MTWTVQQPLAERFELVMVERPCFPPNPPVDRVDFESDAALVAELLDPGDHLVGHSYGGVISMLAAAQNRQRFARWRSSSLPLPVSPRAILRSTRSQRQE